MDRILRPFARRYRFAHPTTMDLVAVVNEVTGEDWRWFFEETFYSSGLCDYAVEVLVELADGRSVRERWDGRERWTRFEYTGAKVVRAVVDPEAKIALDVDPRNNEWIDDTGPARRAATKWAARWMFWLQNLLELHMVVG